jgi:hypothetical protein
VWKPELTDTIFPIYCSDVPAPRAAAGLAGPGHTTDDETMIQLVPTLSLCVEPRAAEKGASGARCAGSPDRPHFCTSYILLFNMLVQVFL